jgi:hypothetical protein
VLCAAAVQSPALGHFFRDDDFLHLYQIVDLGYMRFVFTPHGGHVLTTTFSIFYLCYELFGLHAEWYTLLALATHLLNVFLLYRIVDVSSGRPELALLAALFWGMSGLAQGSVGWYSVYGHVLAATFSLWFLVDVARVARGERELSRWAAVRWNALLLAAATSFGTGIAVAMLAAPATYLLLGDHPRRRLAALSLCALPLVIPILYVAAHWTHAQLVVDPAFAEGLEWQRAAMRPSSWLVAGSLLGKLVAYGVSSLLLGPFLVFVDDRVPFAPLAGATPDRVIQISYAIAAIVLAWLVAAARRASAPRRQRLAAYSILIAACYGIIAVGRGVLYDHIGFLLPKAAVQPRYHYLAAALVAVPLALAAAELTPPLVRLGRRGRAVVAALLGVAVLTNLSGSRAVNASLPAPRAREDYDAAISEIQAAIQSRPPGSIVRIENRTFPSAGLIHEDLFPGWAALFVIHFPENEVDGRRVHFVERNPRRLANARRFGRTRVSEILVVPGTRADPGR